MERRLGQAIAAAGFEVVRSHPYKEDVRHGFIASQREGIEVFRAIDPRAPLIVAEAVWQYSHHVLAGPDYASRARFSPSPTGRARGRDWLAC